MQNTINSDLIRGHIDTIILSILYANDRYGYEILGEIDEKSNGQYKIKQPTLYSCLKRLESQGFIYSYRGDETESGGGRRKYYALTEMGKELFRKNQTDWEYSRTVIDKLVSDKPFQFVTVSADSNELNTESEKAANEQLNNDVTDIAGTDDADNTYKTIEPTTDRSDENIDEYFTETTSASYIDKVVGNPDIETDDRSAFQIHSFSDDLDEDETNSDSFSSDNVYANNFESPLFADEAEEDYLHKNNEDTDFESVTVNDIESIDEDTDQAGLFKSYNVDISEVEEYNHNAGHKKTGKSLLDQLEEEAKTRKENNAKQAKEKERNKEPLAPEPSYESDNNILINREYRNIIKQLLSGNDNITGAPVGASYAAQAALATPTDNIPESTIEQSTHKQWREQANFDKVTDSVRDMGDNIKIRTYNSETDKEYTNLYYYYPNKLMLYQYGAMFILMLIEILVPFLVIKFGAGINAAADIPILIVSCLIAAAFPVYAVISNFNNPDKRKRYNLDFKNSFVFRIILFVLALVIIFLVNVVCKMDVANPTQYLMSLIIPALLCTNLPISLLIFRSLYHTERFNAE